MSLPQGTAGLSDRLKLYFNIAQNPEDFATEITDLLSGKKATVIADRNLLESLFGFQAINHVLQELQTLTMAEPNEQKFLISK